MNIRAYLEASAKVLNMVPDTCESDIRAAGTMLRAALAGGHTIYWCGNGGSAADAQHFSAELVGGMGKKLRPYASVALTTDTSFLTAYANDVGYEEVFVRQVEALGKPGDVLVGISTSGESMNVLRALDKAAVMGLGTILLTRAGCLGWERDTSAAEVEIAVPSRDTQHIQEAHTAIGHLLCLLATEQPVETLVHDDECHITYVRSCMRVGDTVVWYDVDSVNPFDTSKWRPSGPLPTDLPPSQTYQEAFTEKYNRSRDLGWDHDEAVRRATHEAAHYA